MSKKLFFGTDGIRGRSNTVPMTPEHILKVGQALGYILRKHPSRRVDSKRWVVIGKDTRLSGYMLEQALAAGLNSMGVHVQLLGPLPTPGIGFLTANMRADAGVVISASHNSYEDNGVKIFGPDGFKLSDQIENEIEEIILDNSLQNKLVAPEHIGRTRRIEDASGRYVLFVKNTFPLNLTLDGFRIVIDCANGSSYKVAPTVFEELGAEVFLLGNEPNGYNINAHTGALYPENLAENVLKYRADIGIALDGDGDRSVIVDEQGKHLNGDSILAICASYMAKKKQLKNNTVVITEMSNHGLIQYFQKEGIEVVKTQIGDKYIVEEMRKNKYNLGGESSGHIVFLDHSTTGDGCIAGLKVLSVMKETGKKLSELNEALIFLPQVLNNVMVKERQPLESIEGYNELISEIEKKLERKGRIFVRYSGTEPVVRILVEGESRRQISEYSEKVAQFLKLKCG